MWNFESFWNFWKRPFSDVSWEYPWSHTWSGVRQYIQSIMHNGWCRLFYYSQEWTCRLTVDFIRFAQWIKKIEVTEIPLGSVRRVYLFLQVLLEGFSHRRVVGQTGWPSQQKESHIFIFQTSSWIEWPLSTQNWNWHFLWTLGSKTTFRFLKDVSVIKLLGTMYDGSSYFAFIPVYC